jgi:hypothetical protein
MRRVNHCQENRLLWAALFRLHRFVAARRPRRRNHGHFASIRCRCADFRVDAAGRAQHTIAGGQPVRQRSGIRRRLPGCHTGPRVRVRQPARSAVGVDIGVALDRRRRRRRGWCCRRLGLCDYRRCEHGARERSKECRSRGHAALTRRDTCQFHRLKRLIGGTALNSCSSGSAKIAPSAASVAARSASRHHGYRPS